MPFLVLKPLLLLMYRAAQFKEGREVEHPLLRYV